MDSVLISHFLTTGIMDTQSVINEVLLFLIGTGMGILVNLTLRKDSKRMEELTVQTDEQIKHILKRASERVLNSNLEDYDGKCLDVLTGLLEEAQKQALTDYRNDLIDSDTVNIKYIDMRRKQAEILFEIYRNVSTLKTAPETAKIISDFLDKIAAQYDRDNDVTSLINECDEIQKTFDEMPLPESREEFEDRARLFVLMRSIEDFLKIKKEMFK